MVGILFLYPYTRLYRDPIRVRLKYKVRATMRGYVRLDCRNSFNSHECDERQVLRLINYAIPILSGEIWRSRGGHLAPQQCR